MRRTKLKVRILSWLMAVLMVFGAIPETALTAYGADRTDGKSQVRVIVENTTYTEADGACWDGTLVDTWVDLQEDSTMATCLVAALNEYGYSCEGAEYNYITKINGLVAGSPDYASGWMVLLNDWFTSEGVGAYKAADGTLEDGDEIKAAFSCYGYGSDLGGSWGDNDKSVKALTVDCGVLSPAFDSTEYAYTLTVPADTQGVVVTPTASNKNFQVRASVNGTEYKRTATIPVENGTVITVTCGDTSWPTMNAGDYGCGAENVEPCVYTITVAYEKTNTAPELSGEASANAQITVGEAYTLDLGTVFKDSDGDTLTYTVSVDGAEAIAIDQNYSFSPESAGTYSLVFAAKDGQENSPVYTVSLIVEEASAGTAVPVSNNVIDITDYTVGTWGSRTNKATNITVVGGDVLSATEDGTTVNVLLDSSTDGSAELTVTFGTSCVLGTISQDINTCTLEAGSGTMTVTLNSSYSGNFMKGSVTYTINFTGGSVPTEVPNRKMESDTATTYACVALDLNLKNYFEKASTYYLVENENLTPLEGSTYSFKEDEVGTYHLTFAASNVVGTSTDYVTVTVTVEEIKSGIYIGYESSNGSFDSVQFTDADGAYIDGLNVSLDGTAVSVVLPKSYALDGKVTAAFNLTQNEFGLPFLSTKTGTSGVSSGKAVNNKVTSLTTTLSGGSGTATVYYYNTTPTNRDNNYITYTISYKVQNDLPKLSDGQSESASSEITAGENYEVKLGNIFTDEDGDTLTYQVKINDSDAVAAQVDEEGTYRFTTETAGEYTLVFTANDGKGTSTETYTVQLTVKNTTETYTMTVKVPEDLEPAFYAANGFEEDGTDVPGDKLTAVKGETKEGFTAYSVTYPTNAQYIRVRTEEWGGMAVAAEKDGSAALSKVKIETVDFAENALEASVSVEYGEHLAVCGTEGYLLVAGTEYTCTAVPADTATYVSVTEAKTVEEKTEVQTVVLSLSFKSPKTITVPKEATAQMFAYNKYYDFTEIMSNAIVENEDGTKTYYFVTSKSPLSYRASMEGKVTEAGYWSNNLTITFDDGEGSSAANAAIEDNSVLVNVNGQNHLRMQTGDTYTLKGYRAWEIIKYSYQNEILTPDFHFTVLSGSDVISLTPAESRSNSGSGNLSDWMTVTALKEGTAVIEVSYDAMDVVGGSWPGLYEASDASRTGLVVVTVGGADTSVDFGIQCYASAGSTVYNANNSKKWDAEFDTLYFTGESGELKLSPTASGNITKVEVSNDKGNSWTLLSEDSGSYTAKIVSGNNIIRVTTDTGTAYQVVRGDQVTVTITEVSDASDGDGLIEAGEAVRITLDGLHTPIPKMAGNYNPGYQGNTDGDSSVHLSYTFNGATVSGTGAQYTFASEANYMEVTIPEDYEEKQISLTDGYIGVGVIGLTTFADGGDSHRNIPDGGCATRGSLSSFHTRSILPVITLQLGEQASPNTAPVVAEGVVTEGNITVGQSYALNPETLFTDKEGDSLTYTVSVNGGATLDADAAYKFSPATAGTYILTFTASDGKESVSHSITLQVTASSGSGEKEELTFDISGDEIAGYVEISIEDNGVRETGATGLKYPVPLGTIVEVTRVPFAKDDTIADVTLRLLDAMDIDYTYTGTTKSGFYLASIENFEVDNTPYDKMGEFDAGSGSGWMVTQNGTFINQGASQFTAENGDVIKWQYTCQLGADIGDEYYQKSIDQVETLIDAIGTVTSDSKDAIKAARDAYDALNAVLKKQVENYDKLTEAEKEYAKLLASDADEKAAAVVEGKIAAIGEVTLDSETAIEAARSAYDALTEVQKALVENYETLTAAENKLNILKNPSHEKVYKATGDYLEGLGTPSAGSVGGEWMVLGLARSSRKVSEDYYNAVAAYVKENINEDGQLHWYKSTENSRVILGLTAAGYDPTDVEGYNLLGALNDITYVKKQGINGPIWALIAFDSHGYEIPEDGDVSRDSLINVILDAQLTDGGWTLSGTISDPDMTAMAMQALAPYYDTDSNVKDAVDKALIYLSKVQNEDGSFSSTDGANAESAAQVIVALTALGINPETDTRFSKNGISVVDALCNFAVDGGGFKHIVDGKLDGMATEQGYYALVSYMRFLNGQTTLYDMSDITLKVGTSSGSGTGNGGTGTGTGGTDAGTTDEDTQAKIDQAAAEKVEALIDAIGTVTVNSGTRIKKARNAYNSLTAVQKKLVSNYQDLKDAEEAYVEAKVQYVEDLIDSIGTVTLNSKTKIDRARTAYENLSDDNKSEVSNLSVLEAAEAEYAKLLAASKTTTKKTTTTTTKKSTDTEEDLTKIAQKVKEMLEDLNDDSLVGEIVDVILAYEELTEEEKEAIDKEHLVEALKERAAELAQTDQKTGIAVSGVAWNIKLTVEDILEVTTIQEIQEKLSGNSMLGLWNIYLEDMLTGEKYEPSGTLLVKIPLALLGNYTVYDGLAVVHYGEDGNVEYLNCTVVGDCIVFNTVEFSNYAVVGYNGVSPLDGLQTVDVEEAVDSNGMPWIPWVIAGGCGVALLAVLLLLAKKNKNENQAAE